MSPFCLFLLFTFHCWYYDTSFQAALLSNLSSICLLASQCEGLLTPGECLTALQGMARRKAPGLDGLPIDFYLKFWDVICSDLVSVFSTRVSILAVCLSLSTWWYYFFVF